MLLTTAATLEQRAAPEFSGAVCFGIRRREGMVKRAERHGAEPSGLYRDVAEIQAGRPAAQAV